MENSYTSKPWMGPAKYKLKMPFKSLDEQKWRSLEGEGDI